MVARWGYRVFVHIPRRLLTALVVAVVLAPALAACHSAEHKDTTTGSSAQRSSAGPAAPRGRQFIPELDIYVALPDNWVAFTDSVHDNRGMPTYQLRPKWQSPDFAQYVRVRKILPTDAAPETKRWLASSNADAVDDFVKSRKGKIVADKRDSWDGPNLPGASATLEFEKPAPEPGSPPVSVTPRIYVSFVGEGDQRWQIATSNGVGPNGIPADPFLGEQANTIAHSVQRLNP